MEETYMRSKVRVIALVIMAVLMITACAGLLSACNFGDNGGGDGDTTLILMAYAPANEEAAQEIAE